MKINKTKKNRATLLNLLLNEPFITSTVIITSMDSMIEHNHHQGGGEFPYNTKFLTNEKIFPDDGFAIHLC